MDKIAARTLMSFYDVPIDQFRKLITALGEPTISLDRRACWVKLEKDRQEVTFFLTASDVAEFIEEFENGKGAETI